MRILFNREPNWSFVYLDGGHEKVFFFNVYRIHLKKENNSSKSLTLNWANVTDKWQRWAHKFVMDKTESGPQTQVIWTLRCVSVFFCLFGFFFMCVPFKLPTSELFLLSKKPYMSSICLKATAKMFFLLIFMKVNV